MSEQVPQTAEVSQPAPKIEGKPTEEVKVEGTPEVKEEAVEDIKSRRFAELSKREQKILRKDLQLKQELKQREDALTQRQHEIKEQAKKELRELAKKNPLEALRELGTDYNSITEFQLGEGKLTPEKVSQSVDEKIAALEAKLKAQEETFQQREQLKVQEENERILKNFSATIVDTVKNNVDKYPAVHHFNGAPVIYEMIQKRWHDTNGQHLMTVEEAAAVLEEDLGGIVDKLLQSPKYASRVTPQTKKEETKINSLNKPKTITNELTSSAPSMLPPKTEDDRIRRALEKLQAG
jgi:hypothetical protein